MGAGSYNTAAPAAADGMTTLVPAELVIVGPAVVPAIAARFTVIAWVWMVDVTALAVVPVRVPGVPRVIVRSADSAPPPVMPFPASTLR